MTEPLTETPKASGGKRKAKRWLLLAVAACVAVFVISGLMPEDPLDLSKEEEPFRSMVLPVKSVEGYCVLEGEPRDDEALVVGAVVTDSMSRCAGN
ncbi:MAG: hypothetical protein ABIS50_20085 [Luteolibacter sp.]|uniref:hypothetical protein n=1 Tax=Luteolibacter sp. TaxID=1962973 RepID=UPI003263517C